MSRLRQYFITGLAVWLPMGVTVWMLLWLVGIVDGIFSWILRALSRTMPGFADTAVSLQQVPGLGVLLLAVLVVATGLFVTNIIGQWWLRQWNRLITHIPVVRSIYSSVQQVSSTLFSGSGKAFSKALLVRYPHQESWTIAFLTGSATGEVAQRLKDHPYNEGADQFVSVFVPTTPNPTSGFFLLVARRDIIELNMTVHEALTYVISMGVVSPSEIKHEEGQPVDQPLPPTEPAQS